MMAKKSWQGDFRYPCVLASIRGLGAEFHDDYFSYPGSFCLPQGERPLSGATPSRIYILAMGMGFALLVGALVVLSTVPEGRELDTIRGTVTLASACFAGILSALCFLGPLFWDRAIISWLLKGRSTSLRQRFPNATFFAAELIDANHQQQAGSMTSSDHLLVGFDRVSRRMVAEGLGATYQIRASDIVDMAPLLCLNYIGVELTFRVGDVTQRIAVTKVSILFEITRQWPFLGFVQRRIPNRLYRHALHVFMSE